MEPGVAKMTDRHGFNLDEVSAHVSETFPLRVSSVSLIPHGVMSANYVCHDGEDKYICKIYNHKTLDEITFQIQILAELEETNFPCPRLLKTLEGGLVSHLMEHQCIVYKYIQGEMIESVSETLLSNIGTKMAELHVTLQNFTPSVKRISWDPEDLLALIAEREKSIIDMKFPEAEELLSFLKAETQKFEFPEFPQGITHQDMKPENILVSGEEITGVIDFDNAFRGFFIFDIATTIIWCCFKEGKLDQTLVDVFLKGYESVRPLESVERKHLENAIRWRLLRELFVPMMLATPEHFELISKRNEQFKTLYLSFK